MELWIRSQDKKELVKPNDIYLVRENKYFHIYCYANNSEIDLGQYGDFEDKTRALEVLDEIQNLLTPMIHYEPIIREKVDYSLPRIEHEQIGSKTTIQELSTIVYEMPKE